MTHKFPLFDTAVSNEGGFQWPNHFDIVEMSAKIIKNTSYFSRFQTKYRRRRECKTDYVQRTQLIQQDKTKYGAAKYRLVARITNTKVIAQIVVAHQNHDETLCQANSIELKRYGIQVGLANYAAAYATGLLVARRFLTKLNLTEVYDKQAQQEEEDEDARRPFKVILDVGLARTTTGAKVFAVMKGASDGGLYIPHEDKRLAGGEDAEKQRFYILGGHVAHYMEELKKKDEAAYNKQFSRYVKAGITADKIKGLYEKAHEEIRKNPAPAPKATKHYQLKKPQTPKMSFEEKRKILNEKLVAAGLPARN